MAAKPNAKDYQTIFPQYIDAQLAPSDGRRLTKAKAVANPSIEEILTAVKELGFAKAYIDPVKSLPAAQSQDRCIPPPRGCVKVQIKAPRSEHYVKKSEFDKETRAAIVDAVPTKAQLLVKIAELIKAKSAGGARPPRVDPSANLVAAPTVGGRGGGGGGRRK